MENNARNAVSFTGTLISAVGASMSITEVQAIVSIIVTILGFLITIISSIVVPTIKAIIKAKKDGKIDEKDIEDIGKTLENGFKDFNDKNKLN